MSSTDSDSDGLLGTHISDDDEKGDSRSRRDRVMRAADPEKQQKYSNQEPVDAQGRKRFHGAFTGGFSAGYYNTAGSEEGWAPSEWKSSRDSRSQRPTQRAEDFMDEEDLAQIRGLASLTSRAEYALAHPPVSGRPVEADPGRGGVGDSSQDHTPFVVGADVLNGMLRPSAETESVGYKILRRLGWREGFGIGPRERRRKRKRAPGGAKVYGCDLGPIAGRTAEVQPLCVHPVHVGVRGGGSGVWVGQELASTPCRPMLPMPSHLRWTLPSPWCIPYDSPITLIPPHAANA
jgi:G patch domain-containing protein 1